MNKKTIELENKERVAYLEQGNGDKTLVLIHGNFSSSLHFSTFLETLPKNVHVLAPDLRGYGDSSYDTRIRSMSDWAEDVHDFLELKGIRKAAILGWSLGGGVAMEFAALYPEMTEELILVNSTTHKGYPVFKKDQGGQPVPGSVYSSPEELATDPVQVIPLLIAQKNKDFNLMSFIFDRTIYTVNKPTTEDNKLWIDESLKQVNLVDADWALTTQNMSDDMGFYGKGSGKIKDITAPTLHTWGDKDITVPRFMIDDNVNAIRNSTLKVYENCGHSPFVDNMEGITKDILDFIKQT
jgi:pimeloyl-ACP methyl ester carboxylesterase